MLDCLRANSSTPIHPGNSGIALYNDNTKYEVIKSMIDKYSQNAKQNPTPFLNHVDYFRDSKDGTISISSISDKWSALTGEGKFITNIKGYITIATANSSKAAKGCPYRDKFQTSAEIMPCLKHSRSSAVVNGDGSINEERLRHLLSRFTEEYDGSPEESKLILTYSQMLAYLAECYERDKHLPNVWLVADKTLAAQEWKLFFRVFTDVTKDGDKAVTIERLLQFYYNGEELYAKILSSK